MLATFLLVPAASAQAPRTMSYGDAYRSAAVWARSLLAPHFGESAAFVFERSVGHCWRLGRNAWACRISASVYPGYERPYRRCTGVDVMRSWTRLRAYGVTRWTPVGYVTRVACQR